MQYTFFGMEYFQQIDIILPTVNCNNMVNFCS